MWMKDEAGREIRVDGSQVAAFKERGFEVFDKPADPKPKASRRTGNQANMGRTVQMERDDHKIRAEREQVASMKEAGWKVSDVQPKIAPPVYSIQTRGRDPVHGSVCMTREGCECTADVFQIGALKAAGWTNPKEGNQAMRLRMSGMITKDQPFTVSIEQQLQGSGASAAGVQFSDNPEGPWETARPAGGGGTIEAPVVPFDERVTPWEFDGIIAHGHAWMRIGAWPDQGLTGPPSVWSNAVEVRPKVVATQPTDDRDSG